MAADEVLLQEAIENGQAGVRVYQWSEPTLSLGYFQTPDDIPEPLRSMGLPAVRRLSGGGTILHHHEVTYSFAVPASHNQARVPKELYIQAHEAVIRQLALFGVSASLRGWEDTNRRDAFLCFARGDWFDVVMGAGHKVVGSAQRRRRGAILQHGSIVLRRSALAPQFLGIEDLSAKPVSVVDLATGLSLELGGMFAANLIQAVISQTDCQRVHEHRQRLATPTVGEF